MNFDVALQRVRELADSTLALLPGLALGLVVFGVFVLVGRLISEGLARAARLRSGSSGLGLVLGRVSRWVIGLLGVRIWVQHRVDFGNPVNLMTAAIALIVGIADYTWVVGDLTFAGIALGTGAALVVYHLMTAVNRATGAVPVPETDVDEDLSTVPRT